MSNAMDRFRKKIADAQSNFAARGGTRGGRKQHSRRQWTRQIVITTRWDLIEWTGNADVTDPLFTSEPISGVRNDTDIDEAIRDIFYGNISDPEERPGYLNGPELLQDIFQTFLRAQPTLFKKSEVKKDARLNGKFIEQMMSLPAWEEVHDYTMTDPQTAKEATLAFVEVLKEMIKQHRDAVEEANKQREEDGCDPNGDPGNSDKENWDEETPGSGKSQDGQGNSDRDGDSQLDDQEDTDDSDQESKPDWDHHDLDGDGGQSADSDAGSDGDAGDDDDDGDSNLDDFEREFNEDYAEADYDDESDWERLLGDADFGRLANRALEQTAEDQQQLDATRKSVGIEDAEWKMMDPAARLTIAQRLNTPRMRAIADMVGRMKRFAMAKQAQKITDQPHEIYTVEIGNDMRRVLRSEYGLLGTPETKIEFYRRYISKELLQYKERGHEDVGKGPIICCIDNSGSMGGAPENWAKGVAEALRRICQDQDRDFYVIYFETNRHRERFDFPKGRGPFEKVMAFLGISAGGGTEFDGVLTEALSKAVTFFEGKPEHGKSDIVFITDGEAHLNAEWIEKFNAERREAGVRCFGIYISAYDSSRGPAMRLLESFCDVAIPVKALEVNDETTDTLFAQI